MSAALTHSKSIRVYIEGATYQNHYEWVSLFYGMFATLRAATEEAERVLREDNPITIMYASTAKEKYCIQLERDGSLSVERL